MDKRVISETYKELKKPKQQKNNLINKWANELDSSQKMKYKLFNKYMNKCSTSLAVREMYIENPKYKSV
jgi:hypothetical protein